MSDVSRVGAYPKTVVLTDGAHLVLRVAVPADAPALTALGTHLPPGMRWEPANDPVVSRPDNRPARVLTVVACDAERVVAAATLTRPAESSGATDDLASVAVRIDPAYQGRRLGTWMLLDCVHLAAALDIELLVALAHPEDEAYLAALHRLDFVDDGALRRRHRFPEVDASRVLALVKAVHREWTDF